MPIPSTLTLDYGPILSTTFFNARKVLEDAISTANAAFFYIMKKGKGVYKTVQASGERLQVPLMHALGSFDTYNGYDVLSTTPTEGITSAFYDWRQYATPVAISGKEMRQNRGEEAFINLLEGKVKQAKITIQEGFSKTWLQGNGVNAATAVETAYTSVDNSSAGVMPIALMVAVDPTTALTIGNIAQNTATNVFWRNQKLTTANTNYASFLKNLRQLHNDCGKGPGGFPNLHICDQNTYQLFEAALASSHRNPDYNKADIPFKALAFYSDPVVWDEFVINANGRTTVQSTTSGTWYMLNTEYLGLTVDADTNFSTKPFQEPENQDARVSQILWYGAFWTSNRRKQGVLSNQDTTVTS